MLGFFKECIRISMLMFERRLPLDDTEAPRSRLYGKEGSRTQFVSMATAWLICMFYSFGSELTTLSHDT